MTEYSLERRKALAAEGKLVAETTDGSWVNPVEGFLCPEACGAVFASEEAYKSFCPVDCGVRTNETLAQIVAAEKQQTFDLFCLYRQDGRALKVTTSLERPRSLWWWRNVSSVVVHHFASAEDALLNLERLRAIMKPVYDLDPQALDSPRPLSERIPEPISGPHEHVFTFRVSDELEGRIVAQADSEGLNKGEWLRRLAELHT